MQCRPHPLEGEGCPCKADLAVDYPVCRLKGGGAICCLVGAHWHLTRMLAQMGQIVPPLPITIAPAPQALTFSCHEARRSRPISSS